MIAALIIATGKTRQKDSFAPQKEIGTISAIARVVKIFQRAAIERIVIVRDQYGDDAERLASHMGVVFLQASKNAEMLDNVKTGLQYLQDKCDAALITHTDVPLFTVETVRLLMAANAPIAVPAFRGRPGHPLLLQASLFSSVVAYAGEGGLAGAVKATGMQNALVEVDDEGIRANVQYDDDFDRLLAVHSLGELHPDFRLRLAREKSFYGPGAHQLLQLIDETSSLSEACRQMGISYSKGRKIIFTLEQQLGRAVTEGRAGGRSGGYSALTDAGRELMRRYTAYYAEASSVLATLFDKHFSPINPWNKSSGA